MITFGLIIAVAALGATTATQQTALPLWPGGAPGAKGTAEQDIPTLTPFLAPKDKATGGAVVICPGGGYWGLADYEGTDYAKFLNKQGLHCFVLKYRLGSAGYRHPAMLNDAARAVRMVRSNAKEWGVDPKRVAIMGSSAGGHLAATLMTHWDKGNPAATDEIDKESSRPDLGILCYAVISLGPIGHEGSKENLLGKNPPKELVDNLSNEKQVTKDTPPCFIWHTQEDPVVMVENAIEFAAALQRCKVPFELHIYQKGNHGIALATPPPDYNNPHPWTGELIRWLKERGWVK